MECDLWLLFNCVINLQLKWFFDVTWNRYASAYTYQWYFGLIERFKMTLIWIFCNGDHKLDHFDGDGHQNYSDWSSKALKERTKLTQHNTFQLFFVNITFFQLFLGASSSSVYNYMNYMWLRWFRRYLMSETRESFYKIFKHYSDDYYLKTMNIKWF